MYKALILPLATKEIQEIAKWYNKRQLGLGNKFLSFVRKSVRYISENPESVAVRYDNIRTVLMDTFPYMIHYFIDEKSSAIVVVAVLHTSRGPRAWKKK
jgi:plasmid stabilization system protein ParE